MDSIKKANDNQADLRNILLQVITEAVTHQPPAASNYGQRETNSDTYFHSRECRVLNKADFHLPLHDAMELARILERLWGDMPCLRKRADELAKLGLRMESEFAVPDTLPAFVYTL